MVRWLTVLALLGPAVMNGWSSAGAGELQRQARILDFWRLLGKTPDSAEAVREAALQAAVVGDAGLCRQLFVEGAVQYPEQAGLLYFELGGAMNRLRQYQVAASAFRKAIEQRKGLRVSFGYFALATLYERRGDLDRAWKVYQDLLADEESLAIHQMEAVDFAERHEKGNGLELFQKALEKSEKEGLAGLGQEPAAADFQRAAVIAARLKLQDRCTALFREGMRRRPESLGWLQYEFAVVLEGFERTDEALELFRAAKKNPSGLKPSYAYAGLAKLLEKLGKAEEAGQLFAELVSAKDAFAPHVAEAAGFEARQGRAGRGLELYFQAFQQARGEEEEVAVGNVLSAEMGALPGLKELAQWFRGRTEGLPADEQRRLRRALATTFGNHAWKLLNEGAFADAGTSAEMARVIYAPELLKWVEANRAHAYLFQGRFQEAREIHERYRLDPLELDGLDWKKAAGEDFKAFREKGLVPGEVEGEMRKLEKLLGIGANSDEGTRNGK